MWVGLEAEEYDREIRDKTLLKRIFEYFKPYRKYIYIVISLLILSSLSNSFVPLITSIAINNLAAEPNLFSFILLIGMIFILNISTYVFNYFRYINATKAIGNVELDLRENATKSVLEHDLSFFDKNPVGKIVSRINTDSRDFAQTVGLTIEVASNFIVMIILIILLFLFNVTLTLIIIIMIPIFFVIALSYRKLARKLTLFGQRALASVNAFVKESFSGIQIAKTFRQESKLYQQFEGVNVQSYKVNLKRALVLNAIFPSLSIIQGVVLTLLVYYGGNFLILGTFNVGEFNFFFQSLSFLFFPLLTIASFWPQLQSGLSASERIFAIIDTPPVVVQNDDIEPPKLRGEIEFKNLIFQYDKNKKVFDKFSLKINPGESVALVGHTGAGKSSIAKLIARFYEFQGGDIIVDGISIRNYDLKKYREQIGLIPQTPFLWSDTVEKNISYGCSAVSCDDVTIALDKTGGSEWVNSLPEGLQTNVGERGVLLSMGQRQLVVFARVLLQDPSILILDEATASIDPFTETKIQDAMEKTIQGRTSIIIAHRLWTVRHVDRIVVLDQGKIVEQGDHDELMKQGGTYAILYDTYFRHQSLKYIEEMGKVKN
ncbi:MAG: ABC transporter ATP-binding protein [Candidatus Lokiarchaeota archaeon]|nr:ABC transporter ATP-binding protein [Candidatus Lokiarchaeota archaeon]